MKKYFLAISVLALLLGLSSVSASGWNSALDTDLIAYYNMSDLTNSTIGDMIGINDGTKTASNQPIETLGHVNHSQNFSGGDYYIDFNSRIGNGSGAFSVASWINWNVHAGQMLFRMDNGNIGDWYLYLDPDGEMRFFYYTDGNVNGYLYAPDITIPTQEWTFIGVTKSTGDGNATFWVNNQSETTSAISTTSGRGVVYRMGAENSSSFFAGLIDESGIWSRELNSTEISMLWNNGVGVTYEPFEPPASNITITLNYPVNGSITSINQINFSGSVMSSNSLQNVTLNLDGVANQTDSSGINNTAYLFMTNSSAGIHNWNYTACDVFGFCVTSSTYTFNIINLSIFENIYVTNNATIGQNLSVGVNIFSINGFFTNLGSFVSRITKGWFVDLDVLGTTNLSGSVRIASNCSAGQVLTTNAQGFLSCVNDAVNSDTFIFSGRSSLSLSADAYGNPNGGVMSASNPSMGATIPFSGTIHNLTLTMSAAQNLGDMCRLAVLKASTPTGTYNNTNLNATVSNTAQTATNLTYSASVNAGDSLMVFFDEVNSTCTGFVGWTFAFTKN